jgi:hypothetical protein
MNNKQYPSACPTSAVLRILPHNLKVSFRQLHEYAGCSFIGRESSAERCRNGIEEGTSATESPTYLKVGKPPGNAVIHVRKNVQSSINYTLQRQDKNQQAGQFSNRVNQSKFDISELASLPLRKEILRQREKQGYKFSQARVLTRSSHITIAMA